MYKMPKWPVILVFVGPALLLYSIFVLYSYARGLFMSLTNWSGLSGRADFVGLANFSALLADEVFRLSVLHNLQLALYTIIPIFTVALFLAVVLNRPGPWAFSLRVALFVPLLLSVPASAVLGRYIYDPAWGLLNSTLKMVGLGSFAKAWLGEVSYALPAVAAIWIWHAVGFYMLIFYAGLQGIPTDLYDAAKVDGAGPWQQFWSITLPLLWETLRVSLVFFIIGVWTYAFPLVHVMTEGGPSHATEVLGTWLNYNAFWVSKFGYASAMGVALFLMVFVFSAIGVWLMRREVVEY
jgi:N-acetylglucosamine transport system permease protein